MGFLLYEFTNQKITYDPRIEMIYTLRLTIFLKSCPGVYVFLVKSFYSKFRKSPGQSNKIVKQQE